MSTESRISRIEKTVKKSQLKKSKIPPLVIIIEDEHGREDQRFELPISMPKKSRKQW